MLSSACSPHRKGSAVLCGQLQWFLHRHAETDGTHEASPQTQHFLPVSVYLISCAHCRVSVCSLVTSAFFSRCESCRTKLRSYRGLLTHLHTCSKVPRGKTKSAEPAAAPNPNVTRTVMEQDPPHLDSQLTSQVPNSDGSFPAAFNYPESTAPPVLGPPFLSHSVTSASQQFTDTAANVPPALKLDGPAAVSDTPDSQDLKQTQSMSPEPVHPAPGSAPHSPTGSSAVWKRNQGEHKTVTS